MRRVTCAFVTALLLTALPTAQTPARPQRIISLIPAVTEILFAIGAGPQVVAVSSFDEYPPEVKNLQRVGALLDPDLERILSLRPDLVVVYGSQLDLMKQLERAGIPAYNYRHAALPDVSRTIREVGNRIGHAAEAEALIKKIDAQMTSIRQRVSGRARPRTMLVVGREIGALRGIYASGGLGAGLHQLADRRPAIGFWRGELDVDLGAPLRKPGDLGLGLRGLSCAEPDCARAARLTGAAPPFGCRAWRVSRPPPLGRRPRQESCRDNRRACRRTPPPCRHRPAAAGRRSARADAGRD